MRDGRSWKWKWLALSALVSCVAAAQPEGSGGPPPAMVKVDAARLERVQQRREVTGEIRAVQRAKIASEEDGLVVQILIEVGDWVEAGQVLAKLDDRLRTLDVERLVAARESAEASINERVAWVEKAQRDLERLQQLMGREGASKNEVDDAVTNLKQFEARLAQARADLASAKANEAAARERLKDMTIHAPFAGSVVAKNIEVGEWLSDGAPVVELVGVREVDAFLDVPERYIGALNTPGVPVQLRVPALSREIEAKVTTVVALGDRLARTFPVRVRIDNTESGPAQGALKPGMSVVGLVPTGEPADMLTIHKDAVMRNDVGSFVYFDGGGHAAVAPVEMLFAMGERVVVRSPVLQPGMNVITEGNERVFPGQPLAVVGGAASPGGAEQKSEPAPAASATPEREG